MKKNVIYNNQDKKHYLIDKKKNIVSDGYDFITAKAPTIFDTKLYLVGEGRGDDKNIQMINQFGKRMPFRAEKSKEYFGIFLAVKDGANLNRDYYKYNLQEIYKMFDNNDEDYIFNLIKEFGGCIVPLIPRALFTFAETYIDILSAINEYSIKHDSYHDFDKILDFLIEKAENITVSKSEQVAQLPTLNIKNKLKRSLLTRKIKKLYKMLDIKFEIDSEEDVAENSKKKSEKLENNIISKNLKDLANYNIESDYLFATINDEIVSKIDDPETTIHFADPFMSGKCMIYNEEKFVKIEKKSKTFTVDDYLANLTQVLVKSKNKPSLILVNHNGIDLNAIVANDYQVYSDKNIDTKLFLDNSILLSISQDKVNIEQFLKDLLASRDNYQACKPVYVFLDKVEDLKIKSLLSILTLSPSRKIHVILKVDDLSKMKEEYADDFDFIFNAHCTKKIACFENHCIMLELKRVSKVQKIYFVDEAKNFD